MDRLESFVGALASAGGYLRRGAFVGGRHPCGGALASAGAEKAHIEEGRASRRALPLKQMRKNMGSECERFFCSAFALIDYRYIIRYFCLPVKFFAKIYGGIVAFCQSLAAFCAERSAVCAAVFGIL